MDAFEFQGPPQSFDHTDTQGTFVARADLDLGVDPSTAVALPALVAVASSQASPNWTRALSERRCKISINALRQPLRQYLEAIPVHDRHEAQEPASNRDVCNVSAPNFVGAVDYCISQKIWSNLIAGAH
jgi:hypothetical protein